MHGSTDPANNLRLSPSGEAEYHWTTERRQILEWLTEKQTPSIVAAYISMVELEISSLPSKAELAAHLGREIINNLIDEKSSRFLWQERLDALDTCWAPYFELANKLRLAPPTDLEMKEVTVRSSVALSTIDMVLEYRQSSETFMDKQRRTILENLGLPQSAKTMVEPAARKLREIARGFLAVSAHVRRDQIGDWDRAKQCCAELDWVLLTLSRPFFAGKEALDEFLSRANA